MLPFMLVVSQSCPRTLASFMTSLAYGIPQVGSQRNPNTIQAVHFLLDGVHGVVEAGAVGHLVLVL